MAATQRHSTGSLVAALLAAALTLVLIALGVGGCVRGGSLSEVPIAPDGVVTASPSPSPSAPSGSESPAIAAVLPLSDMAGYLAVDTNIAVHNYNLGDAGITNAIGRPVPSPLTGIIAVPDGAGPFPVVGFLHGATQIASIHDEIYAGFDYAVRQMAAQGFVALSSNINVNYSFDFGESGSDEWAYELFDQTMAALASANAALPRGAASDSLDDMQGASVETTQPPFGIDLANKVDLTNIHLVGHSRGGEVADHIYRFDAERGLDRVRSIVRIASTIVPQEDDHPDIPTAIILPEFDGDVDNLGQLVFDEILAAAPSRHTFANAVFLRGANHNFFNRAFTFDDRFGDRSFANQDDQTTWLTRQQQEDFLVRYLTAFYAELTPELLSDASTFTPYLPQPATMFGYPVIASTAFPGMRPVLPEPDALGVARATTQGTAAINWYVQTFPAAAVGHGFFNHPAVLTRPSQRLSLYELNWGHSLTDSGLAPTLAQPPEFRFPVTMPNWKPYAALSLFVAVDSSQTGFNALTPDQSLAIVLVDGQGNEVRVDAPVGTPALAGHPGHFEQWQGFTGEVTVWEGFTPLGELRVPLQDFGWTQLDHDAGAVALNFDFENVTEIVLRPLTEAGAIMLQNAYLVPD